MNKKNTSLEARKALNEFKLEVSEELNTIELNTKDSNTTDKHVYNLKENLTPSDAVTQQLIETEKVSEKNPNFSFSDFLGKYF